MDTEEEARRKASLEMSREQVLADFQACTGIDIGTSIELLNSADWNLMEAVNRVMAPEELPPRLLSMPDALDESVQVLDEPPPPPFLMEEELVHPVALPQRSRILRFTIIPEKGNLQPVQLEISEEQSVAVLKSMIRSSELQVPVCRQILTGWPGDHPPRSDSVQLSSLHLPSDVILQLGALEATGGPDEMDSLNGLSRTYLLVVTDASHGQRVHRLNFPGDKTHLAVKLDVSDLTGIPVRHQVWSGWPETITDDTVIGLSGISHPVHHLTVQSSRSASTSSIPVVHHLTDEEEEESPAEDYEEPSDDMFLADDLPSRPRPLMPDGVEDEALAAIQFAEGFAARYGPCHPMFFQGSLDEAMKESVIRPARDRKLLAVYLHHDGSVSSNVFCTQVLCSESVVSFLSSNFVIWGWDLSGPSNRLHLLNTIARHLDGLASRTLSSVQTDRLPLLLIVTRSRATNEVLAMIPGSLNVDEMMTQLLHALEMFSEQQRVEVAEEEERTARETVKREQDEAYQLSLEADRAKEELKRLDEAVKQRREEEERVRKEQEIRLVELAAQQKEERRLAVRDRLPAEPEASSGLPLATIRFRLPGNRIGSRRFLADDPLQLLLDYLLVEGHPPEEFKVLSSFPRKDLTALDPSQTLRQLGLVPQDTLTIEER